MGKLVEEVKNIIDSQRKEVSHRAEMVDIAESANWPQSVIDTKLRYGKERRRLEALENLLAIITKEDE